MIVDMFPKVSVSQCLSHMCLQFAHTIVGTWCLRYAHQNVGCRLRGLDCNVRVTSKVSNEFDVLPILLDRSRSNLRSPGPLFWCCRGHIGARWRTSKSRLRGPATDRRHRSSKSRLVHRDVSMMRAYCIALARAWHLLEEVSVRSYQTVCEVLQWVTD